MMIEIPLGLIVGTVITVMFAVPIIKSLIKHVSFEDPVTSGFTLGAKGVCLISHPESLFGYTEYIANRIFHGKENINKLYGPNKLQAKMLLKAKPLLTASQ